MDAPDGFVSPTPKAAGKPKADFTRIHSPDFPGKTQDFLKGENSWASGMKI